jgi:hypothetical protein
MGSVDRIGQGGRCQFRAGGVDLVARNTYRRCFLAPRERGLGEKLVKSGETGPRIDPTLFRGVRGVDLRAIVAGQRAGERRIPSPWTHMLRQEAATAC